MCRNETAFFQLPKEFPVSLWSLVKISLRSSSCLLFLRPGGLTDFPVWVAFGLPVLAWWDDQFLQCSDIHFRQVPGSWLGKRQHFAVRLNLPHQSNPPGGLSTAIYLLWGAAECCRSWHVSITILLLIECHTLRSVNVPEV